MSYAREPPFDPAYAQQQSYSQPYYDNDQTAYPPGPPHSYPSSTTNTTSPGNEYDPVPIPRQSQGTMLPGAGGSGTRFSGGEEEENSWSRGEKPNAYPMTRGSIAAQMAAEGQIPKKEGLRMWRSDEHAGALMKGGRGRCCGRVCGCSIILILIIFVSIVASFFLWVKPPSVTFNGIGAPQQGSSVNTNNDGFLLNFSLNIGVINPNFFGATFSSIQATAFYSTAPTTPFGGGNLTNVDIPKYSNSTIRFPFAVNYTTSTDSGRVILRDIADKCGFTGQAKRDLTILYTLKLALKVVAINISPSFSSQTSFPCPLDQSQILPLLRSAGINIPGSRKRSLIDEEIGAVVRRVVMSGLTKRSYNELEAMESE